MSHPWIGKATFTQDGKITFSVEVTDLLNAKGAIEITGVATQANGAFAPISSITSMTAAYNGGPDYPDSTFVDVVAVPTSDRQFAANLDIIAYVEAKKVWVTVLRSGNASLSVPVGPAAAAGATWAYETDGQISAP
jgi:hypothetical protein